MSDGAANQNGGDESRERDFRGVKSATGDFGAAIPPVLFSAKAVLHDAPFEVGLDGAAACNQKIWQGV